MKLVAVFDNVVVKRDEAAEKSKGGIILPTPQDQRDRTAKSGVVLDVGPGKFQDGVFVKTTLKKGEHVMFGPYAGAEVELEGQKYQLLHENEIVAKIE